MKVVCALEDSLVDVKENGRCTYDLIFGTPVACDRKYLILLPTLTSREFSH